MDSDEVIIVDGIPPGDYEALVSDAVKYALISLPFTINRMSIPNEKQRALNIAKGKIAELMFRFFCRANNIRVGFDDCATPFYTIDQRDFILQENEWDIKNNFYYSSMAGQVNYIDLPALVPNRKVGDQWSKRNENLIAGATGVSFLFTYLKGASLSGNTRSGNFLDISLSEQQEDFIIKLYRKYQGLPQPSAPFTEQWFWGQLSARGEASFFNLHDHPPLIITGFANADHWSLFKDTGPFNRSNNFMKYKPGNWYKKSAKGSCNFMGGTLWTTITNATLPVSCLPSFSSLFPHLGSGIFNGRLNR